MNSKPKQQGFTLVELVVVITILGILAAVALPRFTDLQKEARVAKVNALLGSVRAAAANVKAAAIVAGVNCATASGTTVSVEGSNVKLNYCYPSSEAAGIIYAAALNATNDGVTIGADAATAGSAITIQVAGAPTPASCQVSYTSSAAANAAPTIAPTTSGC